MGIGAIPNAVLSQLKNHKDLGIHTEMFADGVLELYEKGVINNSRKVVNRGKIVATFLMGSHKVYDFIDDNPAVLMMDVGYTNNELLIAKNPKATAINSALQVDLTGQVCADSLGTKFYSGIGGQVDFNRGAARSRGGKAIIAMLSTAKQGALSRIVTRLSPGAGVVTTRGDVHYVVTEHGVAYLHGKSVRDRAIALISIAEPKFRSQLLHEAVEAKYLGPEFANIEKRFEVGPTEMRSTHLLDDGTQVSIRPVHPTDEPRMRELFYALSQETIYYRFMSRLRHLPRKQVQDLVFVNHRTDVAIAVTVPEADGEDILAVGRYYLDQKTNLAEVAFVVRDQWQNRGIGTFLLDYLSKLAKRQGITGFTAEVLRTNRPMQRVFQKSTYRVTSTPNQDVYSLRIDFAASE
jgi:GNAT superfamily N-acetyltransferase